MTKRQCVNPLFIFRTHKVRGEGEGFRRNTEGVGVMEDNGLIIIVEIITNAPLRRSN